MIRAETLDYIRSNGLYPEEHEQLVDFVHKAPSEQVAWLYDLAVRFDDYPCLGAMRQALDTRVLNGAMSAAEQEKIIYKPIK